MDAETRLKIEERIIAMLKTVYDPEIPVNVYDLGLIYRIVRLNMRSIQDFSGFYFLKLWNTIHRYSPSIPYLMFRHLSLVRKPVE